MLYTAQKILKYSVLSILYTVYFILYTATQIHAQDVSLVVSPPRIDITGDPGEVFQKTIKVTNNDSSQELILQADVIDFIVNNDEGTPIKVTESASGRFLASPWFTLSPEEVVIPPKETVQFSVVITIPKDALPGGHYSGVYFTSVPAKGQKRTISYSASQVGSLFGITVSGDIKYDALIKDFSTSNFVNEFGPIDFKVTIENQSDTHISPVSQIEVKDMFGRSLETLKLDSINIFPFAERTQNSKWNTVWGFGRYQATLTSLYGPNNTPITRDLFFWIMPYRIIIAILILILVLIAIFISIRRHMLHRLDNRDAEIDELKRKIIEMENNSR